MELTNKLAILADAAKYDASCASSGAKGRKAKPGGIGSTEGTGICHSYTPDGRCVSLLKILLTNYCIYDCAYCINRRSSDVQRARFSVDEVVRITLDFYRRNYIEGLFLSSGIIRSSDYTMEHLIRVAKTLRVDHGFQGYIHLKTIPEAAPELIAEAGRWADRLSINVELPTQAGLDQFAPEKNLVTIRRSMGEIRDRIVATQEESKRGLIREAPVKAAPYARTSLRAQRHVFAPAGQSTQMIVGADGATDAAILETASSLYTQQRLRRVYYSAYSPIPDASSTLPPASPPLLREHRLYQADWLVRYYGFDATELTTPTAPNLDPAIDPKLAWALANRASFPIDLNAAPRELLLRIPGIGVRSVDRILSVRRVHQIRYADLLTLKVNINRALPFIITADRTAHATQLDTIALRDHIAPRHAQLDLFAVRRSAILGEL